MKAYIIDLTNVDERGASRKNISLLENKTQIWRKRPKLVTSKLENCVWGWRGVAKDLRLLAFYNEKSGIFFFG